MGLLQFVRNIYNYALDPHLRWVQDTLPNGAIATAPTGGGAWAYGAYVQIIAATAVELKIVGVELRAAVVTIQFEAAIAVGGAAAEVDLAVFAVASHDANEDQYYAMPYPLDIEVGSRLACRCRDSAGAGSVVTVKLHVAWSV